MTTNYIAMRSNPDLVRIPKLRAVLLCLRRFIPCRGFVSVRIVERAIMQYLEICSSTIRHETWGQGDSLDRERVRDLIIDHSLLKTSK